MQTMHEHGFGAKAIIRVYLHKQWKSSTVQKICRHVDATGSAVGSQAGADNEWQWVTTNQRASSSYNKAVKEFTKCKPMANTLNT